MDELRNLLRTWKAPEPSAHLDERVWRSYRRALHRRLWAPAVAAAVIILAAAGWWVSRPNEAVAEWEILSTSAGVIVDTEVDVKGFAPVPGAQLVPVAGDSR